MTTDLSTLMDRWNSPEGRPYKGQLIDWDAYEADPSNIGCMCAQGQVLHLLAGWDAERLYAADKSTADCETAKVLNISVAHAVLLRVINDSVDGAPSIVLTSPEKVLGSEAQCVLAFWRHLDGMTPAAWAAAWAAAGDAARAAAGDAALASNEIQGAALMRERGQPFFFLPLFGFAAPEDISPLPDDYGLRIEARR